MTIKITKYIAYAIIATIYIFVSSVNASEKISPPQKTEIHFPYDRWWNGYSAAPAAEMYKRLDTKSAVGEEKGMLIMNQFPISSVKPSQTQSGI